MTTTEQEARAKAEELLDNDADDVRLPDYNRLIARIQAHLLAERSQLDAANARADGARAAALREAQAVLERWRAGAIAEESRACWALAAVVIERLATTPPASAATTGKEPT